jgi:hypothetical protein
VPLIVSSYFIRFVDSATVLVSGRPITSYAVLCMVTYGALVKLILPCRTSDDVGRPNAVIV